MSPAARMSEGRAFHAEDPTPAYEKERSQNLDRSWWRAKIGGGCWSESGTRI